MILDMQNIINFYKNDSDWNDYLFYELKELTEDRYYYRKKPPIELLELVKISEQIANSEILSREELAQDDSLRFAIILDAFKNANKSGWRSQKRAEVIAQKYQDILELLQDRELIRPLSSSHKNFIRKLKDELDPTNNLNYITFKDYSNPLPMIAFINGHISGKKRLTQQKSTNILNKILLDDISEYQTSKAKTVILFCINNLVPYLSKSSKKKLLKFILREFVNSNDIFFDFVKRYPDDYTTILFDKEFFIKKFNKFTKDEFALLLNGITNIPKTQKFLMEKSIILANRLYLKPNSGGCRVFFSHLQTDIANGFSPRFSEMVEVIENINYNLKNLLIELDNR